MIIGCSNKCEEPGVVKGKDCVVGEVYKLVRGDSPKLCVKVQNKRYMVSLKTGRQTNALAGSECKYVHFPDACIESGEPK